jgi:hypothetical protein
MPSLSGLQSVRRRNFCLTLSMIFDLCPWGKLSIRLSVFGLRVWLWSVELCCVTEDLGIWGIVYGIRLGLFCSAGRASHRLTRSCSAVFSPSNSALRSFSCCNPPPGWLRHKTCDILGLSLQLCFHALFYIFKQGENHVISRVTHRPLPPAPSTRTWGHGRSLPCGG